MHDYEQAIAELVAKHGADVRGELNYLRERREKLTAELSFVERRVNLLEGMLDIGSTSSREPLDFAETDVPRTLHAAMAEVLETAPERMMRAGDLAAAIERRGLYKMRDGRPVEAQQIHARVGHYPTLFTKVGTFIKLR